MHNAAQRWTVVCDFDGTIAPVDVTDRLLETHASGDWLDIEAEWAAGKIGSRECLSRQIALVRAPLSAFDQLANSIDIDPHFAGFAKMCCKAGINLVIVSDGIDYLIERILRRNGLGHLVVYANSILTNRSNAHRLISPYQEAGCRSAAGTCKCAVIQEMRDADVDTRILFVGDGRSDFCAAAHASDVVAAKSKLLAHLRAIGRPCLPFTTFADVQQLLSDILAERHLSCHQPNGILHECA